MAKKIKAFIKLALAAGKATPAPPVGPALGQHGVNIAGFCLHVEHILSSTVSILLTSIEIKPLTIFTTTERKLWSLSARMQVWDSRKSPIN